MLVGDRVPSLDYKIGRRIDILWALLRDQRPYAAEPPTTAIAA
jgi:hypothetical protein